MVDMSKWRWNDLYAVAISSNVKEEEFCYIVEELTRRENNEMLIEIGKRCSEDNGGYLMVLNNEYMKAGLALNSTTTPYNLAKLAKDESDMVRIMVARSPYTPDTILSFMAYDDNDLVIYATYKNEHTPYLVKKYIRELLRCYENDFSILDYKLSWYNRF